MRVYTLLILLVLGGLSMGYGQQASDFPKYVDTGDKERDVLNYDMQKKAWIVTHTEEYIAMQPVLSEEGKEVLRKQGISQISQERSRVRCESPKGNNHKIPKIAYEDFILMDDEERANIELSPGAFQIVKKSEIENK